jgi:hypothetical protein
MLYLFSYKNGYLFAFGKARRKFPSAFDVASLFV